MHFRHHMIKYFQFWILLYPTSTVKPIDHESIILLQNGLLLAYRKIKKNFSKIKTERHQILTLEETPDGARIRHSLHIPIICCYFSRLHIFLTSAEVGRAYQFEKNISNDTDYHNYVAHKVTRPFFYDI